MTPLGQQIARLLQPEHWDEWIVMAIGAHHFKSGVSVCSENSLTVILGPVSLDTRLGWWERRHVRKLVNRMLRHHEAAKAEAEERAIEGFLRTQ